MKTGKGLFGITLIVAVLAMLVVPASSRAGLAGIAQTLWSLTTNVLHPADNANDVGIGGIDNTAPAFFDVDGIALQLNGTTTDIRGTGGTWDCTVAGLCTFAKIANTIAGSATLGAGPSSPESVTVTGCTTSAIAFCSSEDAACDVTSANPSSNAVSAEWANCVETDVIRCTCLF